MRFRWAIVALAAVGLLAGFQAEERTRRLESGRLLLQHRNWKAAANEFERMLRAAPKDADAHIGLGIAQWGMGDREAALASFGRATALNPASAQAHLNAALALRDAGELDKAVAAARTAIRLRPASEEARLALGTMLQQRGDVAGAIAVYQEALKRNPRSAEGHNWLGVAYMQKSQMAEAVAAFRAAIKLKPDFVRAYNNLGSTLAQAGDLQEGIDAFEAGLKHAPDDLALHLNLGAALRGKGDAEGAIRHFEIVLKRDPANVEVHHQLGHAMREKGDLAAAVSAFESALQLNSEHRASYYGLAQTLRQMAAAVAKPPMTAALEEQMKRASDARSRGDLRGAIESLGKAVEIEPGFAEARYHLGAALWYAGERAKAAEELGAALKLNPASAEAHILRSLAWREAGDLDAAVRSGQRAIALDPGMTVGYFDLGVLFLRRNRVEQALGQFEAGLNAPGLRAAPPDIAVAIAGLRAAIAGHESAAARLTLARMLGLAGAQPKEVIAEFEAALRIEPGNAAAHNGLGLVYTQLNEDEKAIASFREAIRLNPGYADAHGNLGAILTATDVAEAVLELEKAIELDPSNRKAQYNRAIAYGSSPRHGADREIELLRKLLTLEAGYPRADFALGKALLRKGSVSEAVTHLERAAQLEPQFGEAHYQLGLALARAGRSGESAASLQKGRELIADAQRDQNILLDISEGKAALEKSELDDAVAKFRRVLRARPELTEVEQQLRMALERYILTGRFAAAEPHLNTYLKERPDSAWGWYALGYSQFAQRKIGEAVASLSRSLALDVTNADAHKVLGRVLMMIGRFDEAQREFELGEKYNPKSAEIPFNLGRLFSMQDQWVPARDAFVRALRADPDYMEAHDGLGFAHEALGDDAAAVASYLKAAQLNEERKGSFAAPYVNLSAFHNKTGNAGDALEFAKKAVAVNENADRGWYQMARALERRGESEAAAEALKRAIALNGNVSSYHYVLATVYRRLGKTQESREAMERFTRLDRESRELEQKRREAR